MAKQMRTFKVGDRVEYLAGLGSAFGTIESYDHEQGRVIIRTESGLTVRRTLQKIKLAATKKAKKSKPVNQAETASADELATTL